MNKKLLLIVLSILAAASVFKVAGFFSAEPQDENQFIVALLRADGTLVPFAEYGNGGWFNPWPKPLDITRNVYAEQQEEPHSLGNLSEPWFKQCGKIPKTWFFWSATRTPTVVRASQVVRVNNHSQTNWALLTDFPKQSAEGLDNYLGVALNAKHAIEPWIQVTPDAREAKEIVSFIKELFDESETAELERIRAESPQRFESSPVLALTKDERRKINVSIKHLYRSNSANNGEYLFYFEAEKEYQTVTAPGRPACNDLTLFQGWLETGDKGGMGLFDSRLFFTNCDRKGPSSTTPLGMMTLGDRTFLFAREHFWERESYIILELKDGLHRVLETLGD